MSGKQVARKKWKSFTSTISLFAEMRKRKWLDFLLFVGGEKSSVIARKSKALIS